MFGNRTTLITLCNPMCFLYIIGILFTVVQIAYTMKFPITARNLCRNYILTILGPDSIKRCHLTSIGNLIVEIRRSYDRLISTMGFPIPVRRHLYIESGPWCLIMKLRENLSVAAPQCHQQKCHWQHSLNWFLSPMRTISFSFAIFKLNKNNFMFSLINSS